MIGVKRYTVLHTIVSQNLQINLSGKLNLKNVLARKEKIGFFKRLGYILLFL